MSLHVPDVSGPDSSGFSFPLAQEPPGGMPGAGGAAQYHHPMVGQAQVQAEEIALLIFLVMISAGVMLLTESARRHEHAMPRARAPVAHHHDHRHWRRFGVVAVVLALLLIAGLLLYPTMLKGG